MFYVLAALVGFDCGTPWPGRWRLKRPRPDPPWPWLTRDYFIEKVLGVVGGIAGAAILDRVAAVPDTAPALNTLVSFIAVSVAAAVGARTLIEVYGILRGAAGRQGNF
jgi:hypothetical protein